MERFSLSDSPYLEYIPRYNPRSSCYIFSDQPNLVLFYLEMRLLVRLVAVLSAVHYRGTACYAKETMLLRGSVLLRELHNATTILKKKGKASFILHYQPQ